MSFNHVMLDLETMGLGTDAAIISIGAVRMDLEKGILGGVFYRSVNLKSVVRGGGKLEAETVMWWLQQSEEARKALTGDDSVLIEVALKEFADWMREHPVEGLWGNGAAFDNVVLEGAYLRLSRTPPWTYKMNRCYRTMRAMFPEVEAEAFTGVAHNALDDAKHQAQHLCRICKHITWAAHIKRIAS